MCVCVCVKYSDHNVIVRLYRIAKKHLNYIMSHTHTHTHTYDKCLNIQCVFVQYDHWQVMIVVLFCFFCITCWLHHTHICFPFENLNWIFIFPLLTFWIKSINPVIYYRLYPIQFWWFHEICQFNSVNIFFNFFSISNENWKITLCVCVFAIFKKKK